MGKLVRPPLHLGDTGKGFWKKIVAEYEFEPHHLEILGLAAKCLDRIASARELLDSEGVVVRDRFNCPKPHPAVAVELQNKTIFARLIRELGLDLADPGSRPPRINNQT